MGLVEMVNFLRKIQNGMPVDSVFAVTTKSNRILNASPLSVCL